MPPRSFAITLVIAAVSVVLPWSMWPIVPTFTCGLVRTNFSLAMMVSPWNLTESSVGLSRASWR